MVDYENEEYVRHASRFYSHGGIPAPSTTSAVVETVYRKPREFANVHEHDNNPSIPIDRVPTAIGFHSMDSWDNGLGLALSRYEGEDEVRECEQQMERQLERQREEVERMRQEEDRRRQEEECVRLEMLRRQEEEAIVPGKTGEVEIEAKNLVLEHATEQLSLEFDAKDIDEGRYAAEDDTFNTSVDSDSCPPLWRSESEEDKILMEHTDYDQALAEAKRVRALNEVKEVSKSRIMARIDMNDRMTTSTLNIEERQETENSRTENVQDVRIRTPQTKKKGLWNGWLGRAMLSSGQKEMRLQKVARAKPTSQSPATTTTPFKTKAAQPTQKLMSAAVQKNAAPRIRSFVKAMNSMEERERQQGPIDLDVISLAEAPTSEGKNEIQQPAMASVQEPHNRNKETSKASSQLYPKSPDLKALDSDVVPSDTKSRRSRMSKPTKSKSNNKPTSSSSHGYETQRTPVDPEPEEAASKASKTKGFEYGGQVYYNPNFHGDCSKLQSRQSIGSKVVLIPDFSNQESSKAERYEAETEKISETAPDAPSISKENEVVDETSQTASGSFLQIGPTTSSGRSMTNDDIIKAVRGQTEDAPEQQSEANVVQDVRKQFEGFASWITTGLDSISNAGLKDPIKFFDWNGDANAMQKLETADQYNSRSMSQSIGSDKQNTMEKRDSDDYATADNGASRSQSNQNRGSRNSRSRGGSRGGSKSQVSKRPADPFQYKEGSHSLYDDDNKNANKTDLKPMGGTGRPGFVAQRVQAISENERRTGMATAVHDIDHAKKSSKKNVHQPKQVQGSTSALTRDLVTISSIEIPVYNNQKPDTDNHAEDEYSISILGLDKEKNRQALREQEHQQKNQEQQVNRRKSVSKTSHRGSQDRAVDASKSTKDHRTAPLAAASTKGGSTTKTNRSQPTRSRSKRNQSRSRSRSQSRGKSQSRTRSRSQSRGRRAAAGAADVESSSKSKFKSSTKCKEDKQHPRRPKPSSSTTKKKAAASKKTTSSSLKAKAAADAAAPPSISKQIKIKNAKAKPSTFVENFLRRGSGNKK